MAGVPIGDILSVEVDSNEVKLLNATVLQSLQAAGPDGFIVFSTTEAVIPGPVNSTSSLAITSSYALNGGVTQILAGSNIIASPVDGLGAVTISSTGGGGSGAGANITASFTNQSTWTFVHALGNRGVVIQTFDTSWNQIIPQNITLTDDNTATITFPTNQSGYTIASLGGVASTAATASYALNAVSSSYSSYASQAGNSSTINVNVFSAPVDSYLLMSNVAGTTGVAIGGDADLRYNSSTNVLTVPNVSATSLTGSLLGTASWATNALTASLAPNYVLTSTTASMLSPYVLTSSTSSMSVLSSSFAATASHVNTLNQNIIITGSIAIGTGSVGNGENNLLLGPAPAGGAGEGGQIAFLAAGGSYTSSSFIDNWQNQFRILRGPGAVSNAGLMYMDLQSGNTNFIGAVTASGGYNGLPNDYLYVTRNTSQTIGSGTWANRDIIFNNSVVSKGISYNTGTGLASLTGGKVYRITARLAWSAAGAYLLEFSCYDSSNTQLGPTTQIVQSTNGSNNISDGTLDFIYAPGSNVDIKIRTTNNTNALTGESIRGDLNTQLIIQQIA